MLYQSPNGLTDRHRHPTHRQRTNGHRTNGRLAPRLGQHTREILGEAGFTAAEIDALIERKAVMAEG